MYLTFYYVPHVPQSEVQSEVQIEVHMVLYIYIYIYILGGPLRGGFIRVILAFSVREL